MHRPRVIYLLATLLLMLLAGCSSAGGSESGAAGTPSVVAIPEPTASSAEAAASPTAESAGTTWNSGPVIARLSSLDCPDACVGHTFSAPPEMILYSDGRLITNELLPQENGEMVFALRERRLSTQQICALLNTVEQTGFFDYNPTKYAEASAGAGLASNTWIEVNGPRPKQMYLHALREFMEGADYLQTQVEVEPALRDTYRLLDTLATGEGAPYQPERVAIWIKPIGDINQVEIPDERGEWPLAQPRVADLMAQAVVEEEAGIIEGRIEGPNAAVLYELFDGAPYPHTPRIYSEGGQLYAIAVRGLLPYEILGGQTGTPPVIPAPDLPIEPTPLTCSPADGLMEIP